MPALTIGSMPDYPTQRIELLVQQEVTRQFAMRELRGACTAPVGYAILGFALWGHASTQRLIIWFALLCVFELNNIVQSALLARLARKRNPPIWRTHFLTVSILCEGLVFGSSAIFLPPGLPILALFNTAVLAVGAALCIYHLCLHKPALWAYTSALMLPTSALNLLAPVANDPLAVPVGIGCLVVLALCAVLASDAAFLTREGIHAMVTNRVMADDLQRNNAELRTALTTIHELATRDPLTQCLNRRAAMEVLGREMARQDRQDIAFGLISLDLDHFKNVNDRFGHPAGDAVLQATADRVRAQLRSEDFLARMGGEEFLCVITHADFDGLQATAERIRQSMGSSPLVADPEPLTVTGSFGAVLRDPNESLEAVLSRVDRALYRAKKCGRNRVELG